MLLTGKSPFPTSDKNEVKKMIVNRNLTFDEPYFEKVSSEAKDFLKKTLVKEVENRPSAKELLNHSWIKNRLK